MLSKALYIEDPQGMQQQYTMLCSHFKGLSLFVSPRDMLMQWDVSLHHLYRPTVHRYKSNGKGQISSSGASSGSASH
jgi:hypothetical protein